MLEEPLQDPGVPGHHRDGPENSEHPQQAQKAEKSKCSEQGQDGQDVDEVFAEEPPLFAASDETNQQLYDKETGDDIAGIDDEVEVVAAVGTPRSK